MHRILFRSNGGVASVGIGVHNAVVIVFLLKGMTHCFKFTIVGKRLRRLARSQCVPACKTGLGMERFYVFRKQARKTRNPEATHGAKPARKAGFGAESLHVDVELVEEHVQFLCQTLAILYAPPSTLLYAVADPVLLYFLTSAHKRIASN